MGKLVSVWFRVVFIVWDNLLVSVDVVVFILVVIIGIFFMFVMF